MGVESIDSSYSQTQAFVRIGLQPKLTGTPWRSPYLGSKGSLTAIRILIGCESFYQSERWLQHRAKCNVREGARVLSNTDPWSPFVAVVSIQLRHKISTESTKGLHLWCFTCFKAVSRTEIRIIERTKACVGQSYPNHSKLALAEFVCIIVTARPLRGCGEGMVEMDQNRCQYRASFSFILQDSRTSLAIRCGNYSKACFSA